MTTPHIDPRMWQLAVRLGHLRRAYAERPHPAIVVAMMEARLKLLEYVSARRINT